MRDIGVGYAQAGEDLALEPFHPLGLVVGLMIVSQKMQKTMNGHMCEVLRYRPPLLACLANNGLAGDGNVAEVNHA